MDKDTQALLEDVARHHYQLAGKVVVLSDEGSMSLALVWPHEEDERDDGPWLLTVVEAGLWHWRLTPVREVNDILIDGMELP